MPQAEPAEPNVAEPAPTPARRPRRWPLVALGAVLGALVASLVTLGLNGAFDERRGSTSLAGDLGGDGLSVAELLDKVGPSVVSIQVGEVRNADIFGGSGTGFVISADGHILTNAHVVNGAQRIRVGFSDGELREAKLIGSIPDRDIALIRLSDVPSGLKPAELGSSEDVIVGDAVVAIGNALNLGAAPSVTVGIVSAKDRSISAQNIELEDLIQTDAAVNPGNSGGPLVNADGQVIGVVTAIASEGQNIGFALSIDDLKPLITDIEEGRSTVNPDTAFLGVKTSSVDELTIGERDELGVTSGAVVVSVIADSAAEEGGLIPGDVILEVDGKQIGDPEALGASVRSHKPGDKMELKVKSSTGERTLTVTLGKTGG
jgi:S1-C subfamily serine protease